MAEALISIVLEKLASMALTQLEEEVRLSGCWQSWNSHAPSAGYSICSPGCRAKASGGQRQTLARYLVERRVGWVAHRNLVAVIGQNYHFQKD